MSYTPSSQRLWFSLSDKQQGITIVTLNDKLIKRCTWTLLHKVNEWPYQVCVPRPLSSVWFGFQGNAEPSCPAHGLLTRPRLWWTTVTALKPAVRSPRSEGATCTHASHGKELCSQTWTLQGKTATPMNGGWWCTVNTTVLVCVPLLLLSDFCLLKILNFWLNQNFDRNVQCSLEGVS